MRTDMTKLIVAFRNFANAPKNEAHVAVMIRTSIQEVHGSNSGRVTHSPDQNVQRV
jgi:hypothetical protein